MGTVVFVLLFLFFLVGLIRIWGSGVQHVGLYPVGFWVQALGFECSGAVFRPWYTLNPETLHPGTLNHETPGNPKTTKA